MTEFRPRAWQTSAADVCVSLALSGSDRALICACPGSGKTYGGLLIAKKLGEINQAKKTCIVLTPNLAIKSQWIERSHDLEMNLVAVEDAGQLHTSVGDMFSSGFILTYQQAIHMRNSLRLFCDNHKPIAILDEVHHTSGPLGARDGNAWGVTVSHALHNAFFKLCTTGTPFRVGPNPIAFVHYNEEGKATAHFTYSYEQAIKDFVCRPIYFPTYDGDIQWKDRKGNSIIANFQAKLTKKKNAERLRAAVSLEGRFPIKMLQGAHDALVDIRQGQTGKSRAGGLVVAMDVKHAEEISEALEAIAGEKPVVVHNKIDDAVEKINAFAKGDAPWIIGVSMLSEGVDIPRLRVGVYCTNVKAELYFHQFCGRMARVQSSNLERAYVFMPEDPDLIAIASSIEKDRVCALGEDRPMGDSVPGRGRGRRSSLEVEQSDGEFSSGIFGGIKIPKWYLDKYEPKIKESSMGSPSLQNLPTGEIVLFLIKYGILPPFDGEPA